MSPVTDTIKQIVLVLWMQRDSVVGIEIERGTNPGKSILDLADDASSDKRSDFSLRYSKVVFVHLDPVLSDIKGRFVEKRLHSLRISSATF